MQGSTSQSAGERTTDIIRALVPAESSLKHQRKLGEEIIHGLLLFCGAVSILTTIGIVFVLAGQSINFFDSRAWIFVKLPIPEAAPLATLAEPITPDQTSFRINYLAANSQFANQQYLQVGDEIMRIVSRERNTVVVTRGLEDTIPQAHDANADIIPMREVLIRPTRPVSAEDTVIYIEPGYEKRFKVNDEIELDAEVMIVTGVDVGQLTVIRGAQGTRARDHSVDEPLATPDYVTFLEFITNTTWQPQNGEYGIWPLLTATLLTSLVGLLVAIPLGLSSAIYLSEYAGERVRGTLKPILEVLAGIPTVVYGFFALTFVTPALRDLFFGPSINSLNMLSAGLTIGVLITPLISSMCEDAISAVPRTLREASVGLGATKLETTIRVILPAAASGISAAIIVAMSRAVGETMIVLLAAGAGPNFTFNLLSNAETMAGHIARISTGDIAYGTIDFTSIFAVGMTLFIVTFVLNVISGYISERLRERY